MNLRTSEAAVKPLVAAILKFCKVLIGFHTGLIRGIRKGLVVLDEFVANGKAALLFGQLVKLVL